MKRIHLLLAAVTLAIIAGVAVWEWRHLTSPGPLHPSHLAITELQGNQGCAACHGKPDTAMADACSTCHQDIKAQIDSAHGLHGSQQKIAALACASCHAEHSGAKVQLVATRSFQSAGFPQPSAFDHGKIMKFSLIARHTELKCEQCHANATLPSLVKDQKRFLGLNQDCQSCHKDPHEGTYGPDCAWCHGQAHPFKQVDGFVHTTKFPLDGSHANQACKQCHDRGGATSVVTLHSTTFTVRTCLQCHPSPHDSSMIASVAATTGNSQGESCVVCHLTAHKTFLGQQR